jgi:hypothetical protein
MYLAWDEPRLVVDTSIDPAALVDQAAGYITGGESFVTVL